MYHGLVTFTYIVVLLSLYMLMYVVSPLSHMCCFFSLFIHMSILLYNLSIFHTRYLDGSCFSVSVKTSCKSFMP